MTVNRIALPFIWLLMASVLSVGSSCGTSKKVAWSTEHLTVKSAYVQKYVPGQQDEKVISYLFIDLEVMDPEIVLERVVYNGHSAPVSMVKLPLKINWEAGETEQSVKLEANQVVIYFAKGEKHYKQLIEDVQSKEDLYLP